MSRLKRQTSLILYWVHKRPSQVTVNAKHSTQLLKPYPKDLHEVSAEGRQFSASTEARSSLPPRLSASEGADSDSDSGSSFGSSSSVSSGSSAKSTDSGSGRGSSVRSATTSSSGSGMGSDSEDSSEDRPAAGEFVVWEICCSKNSGLTRVAAEKMPSAKCERLTLPEYDMSKRSPVRKALRQVRLLRPRRWVSVPHYNSLQNLIQKRRTPAACAWLRRARKHTDNIAKGCLKVLRVVVKRRGLVYYEWPTRCHGWKRCLPVNKFLRWLQARQIPYWKVRVDACCYYMRNPIKVQKPPEPKKMPLSTSSQTP